LQHYFAAQVVANSDKAWRDTRHAKSADEFDQDVFDDEVTKYNQAEDSDKVLLLNWYDRKKPFFNKLSDECGGCWFTNENEFEKESTGILVDNTRFVQGLEGPNLDDRNLDQYWIFWPREAASKNVEGGAKATSGPWDRAFNLTTSYRLDSDIPRPFGDANSILRFVRYRGQNKYMSDEEHFDLIMSRKNPPNTKYAAWMVSNCDNTGGANQRWDFVQDLLKAGLRLNGFGECFNNILTEKPWTTSMDRPTPFAPYKFYLAFENSIHCNGYLSEKLWRNSYQTGAVPIVFGTHKIDVTEQAPPNSFIHAEDFNTPAELVNYLEYLDNNSTAYLEYHTWRKDDADLSLPYIQPTDKMICGSCKKLKGLKSEGYPKRRIKSVAAWWWRDLHDDQCIGDAELPEALLRK